MAAFLSGVREWLFGSGSKKEDDPSDGGTDQHGSIGHKRTRHLQQQPEPVLQEVRMHTGGVQGLQWYTSSLKVDQDGDAAHDWWSERPEGGMSSSAPKSGSGGRSRRQRQQQQQRQAQQQQQQQQRQQQPHTQQAAADSTPKFRLQGVQQGNVVLAGS